MGNDLHELFAGWDWQIEGLMQQIER